MSMWRVSPYVGHPTSRPNGGTQEVARALTFAKLRSGGKSSDVLYVHPLLINIPNMVKMCNNIAYITPFSILCIIILTLLRTK